MKKLNYIILLGLSVFVAQGSFELHAGNSTDSIIKPEIRPLRLCDAPDSYNPKNPDPYFIIPGYGLFTAVRPGHYIGLDEERSAGCREFILPLGKIRLDQMVVGTDYIAGKNASSVYLRDAESLRKIADMAGSAFRLFPTNKDGVIALNYNPSGTQAWYLPYNQEEETELIAESDGFISNVTHINGSRYLIAEGNTLWSVENEDSEPLFVFDAPIVDFTVSSKGIYVLLPLKVMCFKRDSGDVLFEGCMRRIYCDDGRIYFVAPDGSIFYIDEV